MLSNGITVTRYCANKGVPIGISESDNVGFRRFECLYYEGRVKLTEGTDYTYVVEGSDGSGTGCVVLTGMGDYRGTVEKTFKVKSNEVEPDPSEGKIDVSSAKFVGLAASYARMGQPVILVANLVLGDTLLVPGVDNLDGARSLCPHDSASRAQMAKIILNVEAMRG